MSTFRVMARKKCKISKTNASVSKKTSSDKINKEDEIKDLIIKAPLVVPSNENVLCDYLMKTRLACKVGEKIPKVIPKIKISCVPLNIEKIIDFENNKVIVNEIKKSEKQSEKNSRKIISVKTRTFKSASKKSVINYDGNSLASHMSERKTLKNSRKKLKKLNKDCCVKKLSDFSVDNSEKNEKLKISYSETQLTFENKSLSHNFNYIQQTNMKQQNLQESTSLDFESSSNENLNSETFNIQGLSHCSSFANFDEFPVTGLNDINVEKLALSQEGISDEELKMKLTESENEENKIIENDTEPNVLLNPNDSTTLSNKNQCDLDQINYLQKTSLQDAVETFMKNPQPNYLKKENTALKKGLCLTWLSNNYVCNNQECTYDHNALNLFTKKLKQYPSKFIMTVVVSMRHDILFVDLIMAAFKILSERQTPMIWITFLVYFVFYVTEPSDSKFLKFWTNSARFFCQSDENYTATSGFAALLSIFSQGEKSEEWKIIEFIKLIKQPPIQTSINYALLQPILKMDLPSQFLIEAVESSIITQKDVLKVFKVIVPKIPFMTSPIQIVELLLKFSKTLEQMNLKYYSNDLKQRLKTKVLSFKTRITHSEYPFTASFQEEINLDSYESNSENLPVHHLLVAFGNLPEELSRIDLEASDLENNHFKLEDDFCNLMNETMELSFDTIPSPYKNAMKVNKSGNTEENKEDVCERQIAQIRHFFHNCRFDLLGKYLNELRSNVIERAAKEFLKLSFKMKITLQQVVDLVKIIILPCKTESATKIIASISVTLILNLVRINEWKKAYTIAFLCQEKQINLVEGKVFYFHECNIVTQCRIALLLIEIYAYKNNYASAIDLIKNYNLFSTNNSLWKLTWKTYDETIRIRILEDVLEQIISNQITEEAYSLFKMIYKGQNQLFGAVDLRKFVNEILILLLNQDNENAINLYEEIKTEIQLNETTVRAILITLIRRNRLSEAKNLMLLPNQNAYSLPKVTTLNSITVMISSFWLEEEIYIVFDEFFDSLLSGKPDFKETGCNDLDIQIRISMSKKAPRSRLRPLCLSIIKPSFKDACARIERVLQYQFNPPLKLVILPYSLKLDKRSVKQHLYKRMCRNSL